MVRLKELEAKMLEEPDQKISLSDLDARSMATGGRGSGMVGYNVQASVDAEHHLIVDHDVTNVGSDRSELARMTKRSKAVLGRDSLEVIADRDYFKSEEKGLSVNCYWSASSGKCSIRDKCTKGKERRIKRWRHEHLLEAVEQRLDKHPERMRQRREAVEHPLGTIKSWMGATHFQMKTLKHLGTEMALHVLAYNLKRAMTIIGINPLMAAMRV